MTVRCAVSAFIRADPRLAVSVAEHREIGDVTTLADSSVMTLISEGLGKGGD